MASYITCWTACICPAGAWGVIGYAPAASIVIIISYTFTLLSNLVLGVSLKQVDNKEVVYMHQLHKKSSF